MGDTNIFLDVSSPSNTTYQYLYGEHDQYLENSHSDSHSSATSPYDMTYSGDFMGANAFPSPESRDADDGCDSPQEMLAAGEGESQPKSSAKRKRENRYKNAPPSVLSRRRAQNRASQRAYRERKDQRIKDLEQMLHEARARQDILSLAYSELQAEYLKFKASPSPAPLGGLDPVHHRHHAHVAASHHHQQQLSSSMTGSYGTIPVSSVSADLGGAFVGAASLAVLHAGNELDAYLYPDVGSYAL